MSRYRLRVIPVDDGWLACVEHTRHPLHGYPLGPVSEAAACAIMLGGVLPREHLQDVAARLVVPALPAGLA